MDYFESGFCVRQPSWHKKENLLDDFPETWDDARMAAGLMWEPGYRGVYGDPFTISTSDLRLDEERAALVTPSGDAVQVLVADHEAPGKSLVLPIIDGFRRIVRDDTGDTLAVPKDSFQLIYHHQMGELLEAYTDQWRKAGAGVRYETAGSVMGGKMVWALVRLDEPYQVPGDESLTYPYATLLNAHDGSAACKLMPTQVRVVCWNTWNAASAEGDRTGNQVVLRHTGNTTEKVEQAKTALAAMRDEAKAWQMLATDLATINVSDALVATFLDEFIPIPEAASEPTRNSRAERRALFTSLYETSPTTDGVRGTAYGLIQAAGEYLDHLRPYRNADTYLTRTMLYPEPIKPATINLVRELVAEGV